MQLIFFGCECCKTTPLLHTAPLMFLIFFTKHESDFLLLIYAINLCLTECLLFNTVPVNVKWTNFLANNDSNNETNAIKEKKNLFWSKPLRNYVLIDDCCITNLKWLRLLHSFLGREFHWSTLLNGLEGWLVVTSLLRGPLWENSLAVYSYGG